MALNACTIDGFTLHGKFCRDKFATLVPILHPSFAPGNPRVLRDDRMPPPFEFEDRPVLNFEQPWITVSIEFAGEIHTQQLENTPQSDFVAVTSLRIDVVPVITMSVSDLLMPGSEPTSEALVTVNIFDLILR